ncbi:MAG: hypothetical protein QOI04_1309 [Verrucomicrobiota bacterium]|jgi:hypothetical protein
MLGGKRTDIGIEAHTVGWMIYLITFTFVAQFLFPATLWWGVIVDLVALVFLTLFGWPLVFCINSLFIKILRRFGLSREISNSRVQTILIMTLTTVLALQLACWGSQMRIIGWAWLFVVAANLFSFLLLRLISNGGAERN